MTLNYLVIGMSHVTALSRACRKLPRPNFKILNIRHTHDKLRKSESERDALKREVGHVDVLCLALDGNFHNVMTLLNDPDPYFMVPAPCVGQFVPRSMFRAHIARRYSRTLDLAVVLTKMFPTNLTIIIDPPPPAGDEDHIKRYPGVFAEKVHLGISAPELRVAGYEEQSSVYRQHAEALGAKFLPSPLEARASNGMLLPKYWNQDPTHGNEAYGELVIYAIESIPA